MFYAGSEKKYSQAAALARKVADEEGLKFWLTTTEIHNTQPEDLAVVVYRIGNLFPDAKACISWLKNQCSDERQRRQCGV